MRWIIVLATPFFLTIGVVLLLLAWDWPSYPEFEYARIAPDRFGLTLEERLTLARASQEYLRRPEAGGEIAYLLEELRLPGTDQPVYTASEVSHLVDLKNLIDLFRTAFWALTALIVGGTAVLVARRETRYEGYRALAHGGTFTAAIVLLVIVLILVAWNLVFVTFHEVLFPSGTWTFFTTDSLIRLFPEQFWFDFGVIWTVGILLAAAFMATLGRLLLRRAR
jgi:integral membrane protein (TIGR01906 family)